MILKRLFEAFYDNHIICIFTSNWPPDDLYKNGLQWNLFLPFIDLVKRKSQILTLGGVDYRLEGTSLNDMYFTPNDGETSKKIGILWSKLTKDQMVEHKICKVATGRTFRIPEFSGGVAKMSFTALCDQPLSNTEYMAICGNIHTLIITEVPKLSLDRWDLLRWFIWLVDELYNSKIRVYIQAEAPLKELYTDSGSKSDFDENFAYERCASWLIEMQSEEYRMKSKALK